MQYVYIKTVDQAKPWIELLAKQPVLGIDTETTGLDPIADRIRLFQAATMDGRVALFDMFHLPIEILAPLANTQWVLFNAQFDLQFLKEAGFKVNEIHQVHDLMLMDRIDGRKPILRSLGAVAGIDKTEQDSAWYMPELSQSQLEYAAIDPLVTVRKASKLLADMPAVYQLWCKALPVLSASSLDGLVFDWDRHSTMLAQWEQNQGAARTLLEQHMPGINLNSPKQISDWLYDHLDKSYIRRWPKSNAVCKKTGRRQLKTGAEILGRYQDIEALKPYLAFKGASTLVSTYGNGFRKHRNMETGCLHPSYILGGTRTGRVSCRNPNVQNVPRDAAFRELLIPRAGHKLIGADFGQIELRVAAALSGDMAMIDSYAAGIDLHARTAAAMANVSIEDVTGEQRQAAKAVNFGQMYGMGAAGLVGYAKNSYGVQMTEEQAGYALHTLGSTYPELAEWKRNQLSMANDYGCVQTKLGLVRDFLTDPADNITSQAYNAPVQGSAAEVLLASMVRLNRPIYHNIHDEILLSVPVAEANQAAVELESAMVAGFLDVFPEAEALTHKLVEVRTGNNWAEVH